MRDSEQADRRAAVVRAVRSGEVEAYAALRATGLIESPWAFASSPDDDLGPDEVRRRLDPACNVIIAAFGSNTAQSPAIAIAGIARTTKHKSAHLATIWGVYTHPEYRGNGIGRRVLTRAIDTARAWEGVTGVCLSVSTRTKPAIVLYRSLGFVEW